MPIAVIRHFKSVVVVVGLTVGLVACGPAALPPGDTIVDRDEVINREAHAFNRELDRTLIRPIATAYGTAVPQPVRQGVSNFASNLDQPGYVVNNILQLRLGQAMQNTARFLVNSTIGIGGLLDPASAIGPTAAETDFGETLHIYGFGEGDYLELPVLGPSTRRDAVGTVVDVALNPVRIFVPAPEVNYARGAGILQPLDSRYRFADTIDGVLYESADSYAQLRSSYLQSRRFELSDGTQVVIDPETGALSPVDPLADTYIDPYDP